MPTPQDIENMDLSGKLHYIRHVSGVLLPLANDDPDAFNIIAEISELSDPQIQQATEDDFDIPQVIAFLYENFDDEDIDVFIQNLQEDINIEDLMQFVQPPHSMKRTHSSRKNAAGGKKSRKSRSGKNRKRKYPTP